MLLTYSILGGIALFIMIQDMREQTIPLSGLIVFASASLYHCLMEPNLEGIWAAGTLAFIFMACQGVFYLLKRGLMMGWGDVVLSPFCGLWLHLHELPTYLILTGFFALLIGIFWRYQWRMKTFPLAPALLLGLGIILINRCFFIVNGL